MKTKFSILFFTMVFLYGCKEKEINIYDDYHKSVVMLYHKFVYKGTIDGESIYFNYNPTTGGGFLYFGNDLKMAEANAMAVHGTGFFITKEGKIATNRHVVYNYHSGIEDEIKNIFHSEMYKKKILLDSLKLNSDHEVTAWTTLHYKNDSPVDKEESYSAMEGWKKDQKIYSDELRVLELLTNSINNIKFGVETIYLGYASDGSFVKRDTDYKECRLVNYSTETEVDLAVIQANDGKLPDSVTKFITLDDISYEPLKVGDEVSMLGYNTGPELSLTSVGLKVQNTSGKISQESNGTSVLYSINALGGSSGSPVLTKNGKLAAVNYAGYSAGQSFTYGILAKHLLTLVQE